MALRGIKPELVKKRLKAFFYGGAGVGKTTAAIQFPSPYLIDTEKGSENDKYVEKLKKSGGVVFQTLDFDEMVKEVKELMTSTHEFKTLVIDPMTTLYNDLLEKCALKVGTDFGRHYDAANKKMKSFINLLYRLDMNVLVTSHQKSEYGQNMSVIGQTFDCYKKLDYLFDLVIEVQKRGKERVGLIKKSRIENFGDGEIFTFCYDEISKRYGKEILEKKSISQHLASFDQVKEIIRLIELLKVPEEIYSKWLKKVGADDFSEMPEDCISKCIESLKSKIKGEV